MILYACGSRTSRSTSGLCSRVWFSAARLQKEVLQVFFDLQCCYRFPYNFSNRSMVPKMILRLGFVDLVDHLASSILVRRSSANLLAELILSFRTYRFLNADCRQCVAENDCM